jgi:outer membrane biosynthesis protein TonB
MSRIITLLILVVCCTAATTAQDNSAVHVSTTVMLGRVEHKTMPVYPDEPMTKGIQGDVVFKIEVDETGKITSSVPGLGDPLLIAASKDVLRTFRFRPYLLNGTATKVQSQLGFRFSVQKTADGVTGHVECIASIPDRP